MITGYTWITPSRLLALKLGQIMRAVVLDLTDVDITRDIEDELEDLISRLSNRNKIVDVSVLAEPEKQARLQGIPGVSQVYSHFQR